MIVASVLLTAAVAIGLSEVLGRGRVVYTRMLTLVGSYGLTCALAVSITVRGGGGLVESAAVVLSVIPFMAAWLGFRIHVSNSITLELAGLLDDGQSRTIGEIATHYDVDGHTTRRVEILQTAGYLDSGAEANLADTPKAAAILRMIRLLCGPAGPRAVAIRLHRGDAGAGSLSSVAPRPAQQAACYDRLGGTRLPDSTPKCAWRRWTVGCLSARFTQVARSDKACSVDPGEPVHSDYRLREGDDSR